MKTLIKRTGVRPESYVCILYPTPLYSGMEDHLFKWLKNNQEDSCYYTKE